MVKYDIVDDFVFKLVDDLEKAVMILFQVAECNVDLVHYFFSKKMYSNKICRSLKLEDVKDSPNMPVHYVKMGNFVFEKAYLISLLIKHIMAMFCLIIYVRIFEIVRCHHEIAKFSTCSCKVVWINVFIDNFDCSWSNFDVNLNFHMNYELF